MKIPQKRDMSSEKLGLENSLLFHRFFHFTGNRKLCVSQLWFGSLKTFFMRKF